MQSIETYQKAFVGYLQAYATVKEPLGLYQPIQYILHLGGKRLRPVLTLLSAEIFNADYKNALNAAPQPTA